MRRWRPSPRSARRAGGASDRGRPARPHERVSAPARGEGGDPPPLASRWRLPGPRPAVAALVLAALAVPILFVGLDRYGVVNADEAFYHDVAWTMLETGDWWRVRTDGGEHVYDTFANAPLQYWARGLVISWVGPGTFGMRILSALAGWLTVLVTFALVLLAAGRRAAFLAALLLLFSHAFVYLHAARTGELETGVTLLLVLLALTFVRAIREPGAGFLAHHLCLVALFGWKAPVVPIPLLAEAACFALVPAARPRLSAWLRTALVVAPLALVWHGYQAWRLREHLPAIVDAVGAQAAGTSGAAAISGPAARAAYYAKRLYFGAWPQAVLAPAAIAALWPRLAGPPDGRRDALRVMGAHLVATLGFYCAISKVGPWYVVHALPFLAAWVAIGLGELAERREAPASALLLTAVGVGCLPFVAPPVLGYDPFAASAIRIPMPIHVRGLGPLPPLASMAVLSALLGAALLFTRRRFGATRPVVVVCVMAVVAIAALRVAVPLADLRRTTPAAGLRADLDTRLRAGGEIPFPVDVPPTHPWIAHYYFGHDFVMRPAPGRPGDPGPPHRRFVLVGRRGPPPDAP